MAQAKARHEDWPDRFFNVGFVVDPDGAVILKHYKLSALLPCERSVSPRAAGQLLSGHHRLHLDGKPINHQSGVSCYAEYAVVDRGSVVVIDPSLPLDERLAMAAGKPLAPRLMAAIVAAVPAP